jgi:hypothetical protein
MFDAMKMIEAPAGSRKIKYLLAAAVISCTLLVYQSIKASIEQKRRKADLEDDDQQHSPNKANEILKANISILRRPSINTTFPFRPDLREFLSKQPLKQQFPPKSPELNPHVYMHVFAGLKALKAKETNPVKYEKQLFDRFKERIQSSLKIWKLFSYFVGI